MKEPNKPTNGEPPTTLSIQEETKDIRTEWAARNILDLRKLCSKIFEDWRENAIREGRCKGHMCGDEPNPHIDGCDHCQSGMFWELVGYCKSELKRSEAVRASLKFLDGVAAPVNDAWGVALGSPYGTASLDLVESDDHASWAEAVNKKATADEEEA
jgi:hypothetical protein